MPDTSVDSVEEQHWYVMAAYRFELKAEASLRDAGIEVFLPKEIIYEKKPHRKPRPVERPAIASLIFVHGTLSRILDFKRSVDDRLKFYMTRLTSGSTAEKNGYLTVPEPQMKAFIAIWEQRDALKAALAPLIDNDTATSKPGVQTTMPVSPSGVNAATTNNGSIPVGSKVEITQGYLRGMQATTLTAITARSRTARISLNLSTILSLTLTLPVASLRLCPCQ